MTSRDNATARNQANAPSRGLTLRSLVVCLVALFAMGVWIEYEEIFCSYGGPLAENSPPNSAVGVICAVLLIGGALYRLRRSLRLATAEIVVIYAALVIAAPLMTQGMWHRVFGLMVAIPHNQDFKSYDSLPSMLWPHGENLIRGTDDRCVVLEQDAGQPQAESFRSFVIPRVDAAGREQLVPGENFLFSALVRSSGFVQGSAFFVRLQADDGPVQTLLTVAAETRPSFARPDGFQRVGVTPVVVPTELKQQLTLFVGVTGPGRIAARDIQFLNVEAVEGLYAGRALIRERNLAQLGGYERNFTLVKPDRMFSLAGARYLFAGYIPLRQWARPALAWSVLVGALFTGFLGLNILLRKQWAEHERLTFPLTILPKNLFAEENGRRPMLHNRVLWLGFLVTLPLVLSRGLGYYFPGFPACTLPRIALADYVTSPVLKAFLADVVIGGGSTGLTLSFCVLAITLLIETDVLFSLWSMFLIFQLWNLFGKLHGLTRHAGYPWAFQQAMGAFIAYALIALFIARQHLKRVLATVCERGEGRALQPEATSLRLAFLMLAAAVVVLIAWGAWTGMGMRASLLFFGYMLVCGFAAAKIRAEMGAPWAYLTPYFGMQFVAAMGGFAVFQSTGMLVASIASGFMCTSCFLLMAPAQVEMMEVGRHFGVKSRDVGAGLLLGLLGGLFIGGFVFLCWAYAAGGNNLRCAWPFEQNWYFNGFRIGELNADRALAAGTLGTTPETQALNVFQNPDAKGLGIGVAITVGLAVLRSAWVWFPFHPLGYVLASSYFMRGMWFSVLLAWMIRMVLFRIGGAQAIRRGLVPFCIGMFLAAVASIVIFDLVGLLLRLHGVVDVYAAMP